MCDCALERAAMQGRGGGRGGVQPGGGMPGIGHAAGGVPAASVDPFTMCLRLPELVLAAVHHN